MLTTDAFRERKWGEFPALRQVLESAKPSDKYYGLMSTSDTIFAQLERIMVIAATADEHREDLIEAVRENPETLDALEKDLWRLRGILQGLSQHIESETEDLAREIALVRWSMRRI